MSDKYINQLKIENKNLEIELQKKQSNFQVYDRINFYYSQDDVMVHYVQTLITVLYAVIYFFFIYFLYSGTYSRSLAVFYLILFAIIPFLFPLIIRFFSKNYIKLIGTSS